MVSKEETIKILQERELRQISYIKIIEILRRFDFSKYLITDFIEDKKVNAFFDEDKFLIDIAKKLEEDFENDIKIKLSLN